MALLLVLYVHSIPEIGYDWTCIREKYYWVFPYKVTCCGSEDSSETGISSIWLLPGSLNPLNQKYVEMRKGADFEKKLCHFKYENSTDFKNVHE